MESLEQIVARLNAAVPAAIAQILLNEAGNGQNSVLIAAQAGAQAAQWLRDDPQLRFDFLSNATGVDWPELVTKTKVKKKKLVDGVEKEVEEVVETRRPAYLEAVYHLYSIALKHGPIVIRLRTGDRTANVTLPSLTPVWRGAELQEREIYDLYGIRFEGHPDLRRLLMWEEFQDHPMRKDYLEPDDYEYEPTPHDEVLTKAKAHYPS